MFIRALLHWLHHFIVFAVNSYSISCVTPLVCMLVLWFAFVILNKKLLTYLLTLYNLIKRPEVILVTFDDDDDDDDEIAYFTVR